MGVQWIQPSRFASATFNPLSLSPWALWDASDSATITESSGAVSQWNDKSGNARHLTASSTARPTTNSVTLNGLNAIDFNGTTNIMRFTPSSARLGDSGSLSIYMAYRVPTFVGSISYHAPPLHTTWTNVGRPLDAYDSNRLIYNIGFGSGWYHLGTGESTAVVLTWELTNVGEGSASSTLTERLNGSQTASVSAGVQTGTSVQIITVGGRDDLATNFAGRIGELICFDSILSSTNRDAVESYLRTKWGAP